MPLRTRCESRQLKCVETNRVEWTAILIKLRKGQALSSLLKWIVIICWAEQTQHVMQLGDGVTPGRWLAVARRWAVATDAIQRCG